ncbi:unnamed protein product, partial [Rotaria sordida]
MSNKQVMRTDSIVSIPNENQYMTQFSETGSVQFSDIVDWDMFEMICQGEQKLMLDLRVNASTEQITEALKHTNNLIENTRKKKNPYSNCRWLLKRLTGDEKKLWRKARIICLLEKKYSKKLTWLKVDHLFPRVKSSDSFDNDTQHIENKQKTDDEVKVYKKSTWMDDPDHSLKRLISTIVSRWKPDLLNKNKSSVNEDFCSMLTHISSRDFHRRYDSTNSKLIFQNIKDYQKFFVPLLYHELWNSINRDYVNVDTRLDERLVTINDIEIIEKENFEENKNNIALIIGRNQVTFNDSFTHLNNQLSLFDLLLITIDKEKFFGIVVSVKQIQIHDPEQKQNNNNNLSTISKDYSFQIIKIALDLYVAIYISDACALAIKKQQSRNKQTKLDVIKVTSITSTARMISAVHKLSLWSRFANLLKPDINDSYFHPSEHDSINSSNEIYLKGFNERQMEIINISHNLVMNENDRLRMVLGPPGTGKSRTIAGTVLQLLPNLFSNNKILVCAPSNGACDEIMRRILDEFSYQKIPYTQGTLIRIGGQPPEDESLCEYFHDFNILTKVVEMIRKEPERKKFNTNNIGREILQKSKIIISTLNHCASSRMHSLEYFIDFVIIDEACQALEPDCLNAFRFVCTKIIMVGDPNQLAPTVLSKAGKKYGLAQSLYDRLYQNLKNHSSNPIIELNIQYRMHLDICALASKIFYSSKLETHSSVVNRTSNHCYSRLIFYNMTDSKEYRDENKSFRNEKEAHFVKRFYEELMSNDVQSTSGRSIGVITPYTAQVRYLQSILSSDVEVMTVDGAQGKEKDFIILSCVRDSEDVGFFGDRRRLNVALTRAKEV